MPALRIKLPNAGESTHLFRNARVTVGRAPDNTIQISHGSISSHHAEFVATENGYRLHDLDSTNRSFVEGQPVTEAQLTDSCKILFGSIECEFDAAATVPPKPALPPAPAPEPRPEAAFLEAENRDLRQRVHALQRRFDILGNARLVTGKADLTPYAAADDALKSVTTERDNLRQQNAGLRLQVEQLREVLTVTARERGSAQQAVEALQAELDAARVQLGISEASPLPLAPAEVTPSAPEPPPEIVALPPPDAELLPSQVRTLGEVVAQFAAAPAETALLGRAVEVIAQVHRNAEALDRHAFRRLAGGLHELLGDIARSGQLLGPATFRTLRRAAEFLARLLEPQLLEAGRQLPTGRVLVLDDDTDLLATVTAALTASGLAVTGCASAEDALLALEAHRFDVVIADVHLPGMNGPAFCNHARDLPAYRRTPILFLTVADTLDKRAETSLSGGNEFIAKPFNVAELALKVECWALKHQLHLA